MPPDRLTKFGKAFQEFEDIFKLRCGEDLAVGKIL
jgi:hypothetical protein